MAASDHVRGVITSCAQSLYALRVLRAHGMCDVILHMVYRSVIVARILYAASAWWGYTSTTDRQRIDAFFGRSKKCGFCPPDLPSFEEQCVAADEKLFNNILQNPSHTLHVLLPQTAVASQHYSLRPRTHNLTLPKHTGHLTDSNFITRNLYKNIY
jgi:hypothetical protein